MQLLRLVLAGCLMVPTAAIAGGGKAAPVTQAQQKLGHFTTADGMYGFTLDRSTAMPKLQIDGDKAIIELTMEEDRAHGQLQGYLFRSPDGVRRIYISSNGGLKFFHKGDEHWVTWDKDAKTLGAPTVKGKYVPEVPAYVKLSKELDAVSVRKKLTAMTPEDASNIAKVTEAYNAATAAMFVRYQAPTDNGWGATYQIASKDGAGYGRSEYATDDTESKRHKALAKHNAKITGYSSPDSPLASHVIIDQLDRDKGKLADGTPGLIWQVDDTTAIFVSFDGGRYYVSLARGTDPKSAFVKGAGADTAWPKKVVDTYLDYSMISALVKVKALPDTATADLEKIDDEWKLCVQKGWEKLVKQVDNNPKMTQGAAKAGIVKLHKACNKSLDKYETAIVKLIEERAKARAALLTTATAKAKAAK